MNAARAVARSVSHGEIVTVCDEGELCDELTALADDSAVNGTVVEFWGTTDDGDQWRVHVRRAEVV